jgi:outer membrane protein
MKISINRNLTFIHLQKFNFKNIMKKIIGPLVVLALLSSCQEQDKVAFIDNSKVINDFQMKIDIEERFKLKDEAFKKKTDSVGQAFQIEAQAFQMAAAKMSKSEQQKKYQELGQKQQVLQQQFQYEQQIMQQEFNTEIDSVISKVNKFIEDYGKKNGYTFILGKNQAGSVMYGVDTKDITEDVTKALNSEFASKPEEKTVKSVEEKSEAKPETKE